MDQENALPTQFAERMRAMLGSEAGAFFDHYRQPASTGLRVNTLKLAPEAFEAIAPFELAGLPWARAGFEVTHAGEAPGLHPYHTAGLYYLQEPSAQAVAEVLDPQPGERILDLAAAPGGKTTDIAARMQNRGLLFANEVHPKRVWHMVKNIVRWGARNILVTGESPENLAERLPDFFDGVLVDAPCSGEGMFRKMPEAVRDWSPEFVLGCSIRQSAILDSAARLVRPGGRICYSTCTFAVEENEQVIREFLSAHPDFSLEQIAMRDGFNPPMGGLEAGAVRLWPHRSTGEGHFIALLRREGPEQRFGIGNRNQGSGASAGERLFPFWRRFQKESLNLEIPQEDLRIVKSYLYAQPAGTPDLRGLNILRPGWWLGSFKKERFEPSHALAMSLQPEEAVLTFDLYGEDVGRYLRRETLNTPGQPGWKIGLLEGRYPLGWGKQVGGQIKNHYPTGLRLV